MTTSSVASDLAAVAEALRRVTVRVHDERGRGAGSGTVWSDGVIVTNAHVARGRHATVLDAEGRTARAAVKRRDTARDLALLLVEPGTTGGWRGNAAVARDSRTIRVGEMAVAVGNPLGLVGALTAGLVQRCNDRWVIADVRLAPGSSGGPLADSGGRVIGVNSMVAGGLAFAVPASAIAAFVDGDHRPSGLGIRVTPALIARHGKRVAALLVIDVEAGSRADGAGLMLGDAIVGADGAELVGRSPERLARSATIEIVRAGQTAVVALGSARAA
jgi:serine protease Do